MRPSTIAVKVTRSEIASCTNAIDCGVRCRSGSRGWTKKPSAELAQIIAKRMTALIGFCMRRLAFGELRHASSKTRGAQVQAAAPLRPRGERPAAAPNLRSVAGELRLGDVTIGSALR